jgi:hypothetical protein
MDWFGAPPPRVIPGIAREMQESFRETQLSLSTHSKLSLQFQGLCHIGTYHFLLKSQKICRLTQLKGV